MTYPGTQIAVGDTYGMLTVLESLESDVFRGERRWLCRCECGVERSFYTRALTGPTLSCGCICAQTVAIATETELKYRSGELERPEKQHPKRFKYKNKWRDW